jgi:hypothetical protein
VLAGHYAVSYAVKAWRPSTPLWALFVAVQLLDVLWGTFVLLGIERVSIVPGITRLNPLDLYYMPFTHSLTGALLWSGVAGLACRVWRPRWAASWAVAVAVLSHWALDLLVHRPDLPLVGNRYKVGLGLWDHPALATSLEVSLLLGGAVLYARRRPSDVRRRVALLTGSLLAAHFVLFFVFFPPSPGLAALGALAAYTVFTGGAAWAERERRVYAGSPGPAAP